jgi:acyl dehydratase
MTGPSTSSLTIDQVEVGQELPELSHDVTATTVVLGAMASRDWRPMHHDHDFAVHRNGTADIFLNTPTQAAWFERYLTDWSGPKGRLGRMRFRMKGSVFPGDTMVLSGTVAKIEVDDTGCAWVEVEVALRVGTETMTQCLVRMALPTTPRDNPWSRPAERWQP